MRRIHLTTYLSLVFFSLLIIGRTPSIAATIDPALALNSSGPLFAVDTKDRYIVYPGTPKQNEKYKFDLENLVGSKNVSEYDTTFTGIMFWLVELSVAQFRDFSSQNPMVCTFRPKIQA